MADTVRALKQFDQWLFEQICNKQNQAQRAYRADKRRTALRLLEKADAIRQVRQEFFRRFNTDLIK